MKIFLSVNLLVLVLCGVNTAVCAVKEYGLQELCNRQSTGTLLLENPNWGIQSSAILVASTHSGYAENTNCSVIIQSKDNNNGIVISIRKIDLRPDNVDILKIRYINEYNSEYEKVYRNPNWITHKLDDPSEKESYRSIKNATITFETTHHPINFSTDGFKMVVTTVTDVCGLSQFRCGNGVCIAKELKCDGHNHCGDRSDQEDCSNEKRLHSDTSSEGNPAAQKALIAVGVIVGVIAIVVIIICCRECDCDSNDSAALITGIAQIFTSLSSGSNEYRMRDPTSESSRTYAGGSAGYTSSTYDGGSSTYDGGSAGYTSSSTYGGGSAGSCYSGGSTYAGGAAGSCS